MNTWNAHLYLEKFLLRDNWEPTERFLHNKKEWEATQRRLGNCGRSLESEGAPEDQRSWWASLFAFSLHLDSTGGGSIQVLWPTCKAATGHPQRLFQELVPVEKQNVATVDAHRPPHPGLDPVGPTRHWGLPTMGHCCMHPLGCPIQRKSTHCSTHTHQAFQTKLGPGHNQSNNRAWASTPTVGNPTQIRGNQQGTAVHVFTGLHSLDQILLNGLPSPDKA